LLLINGQVNVDIALVLQDLDRAPDGEQKLPPDHTVAGVCTSMAIIMELVIISNASASVDMKLN
jgi:hypothetical protein